MKTLGNSTFKQWQALPALALTLSPGERENLPQSLSATERGICRTTAEETGKLRLLFPHPGGEGQGERHSASSAA